MSESAEHYKKHREYQKRYRDKNKEKRAVANKLWREQNAEQQREYRKAYREKNKEKIREKNRSHYLNNSESWILANIRRRARIQGIPCDITIEDITPPEVCPVLGIPLERNRNGSKSGPIPNSPAVDRIRPELGYTKGNVIVVSHLANCIKQNATTEQIRKVADYYEKLLKETA